MNWYYPAGGPLPYESMLSVLIKFSHANFVEFPKLSKIANNLNLNLNSRFINNWYRLKKATELELLVPEFNNHLPFDFAPPEGLRKLTQEFAFCPDCIKFGYHSVFNIIKTHDFCVLHKCRLSVACSACTEIYFYGFRFLEPIPRLLTHCDKCGFEDIGLFKEINMRRNRNLIKALRSAGEQQAAWYSKIQYFDQVRAPYYSDYYSSAISRKKLTGPFERASGIRSPERCANLLDDNQQILWVFHSGFNADRDSFDNSVIRSHSLESSLELIEYRYLSKHRECLKRANELTGFPNGCFRQVKLCSVALAYILLRIKIAYRDWPVAGSVCALDSGFEWAGSVISPFGRGNHHRELNILFLSILGRLQFQVYQQANFLILIRPTREFSADNHFPVYIRKSSYAFRNVCTSANASLEVYRHESGGPIFVNFPKSNIEPHCLPRAQMIV